MNIINIIYKRYILHKKLVNLVEESSMKVRETRRKIEIAGPYMFRHF